MLKFIRQFFTPPVFPDDEDKTRTAQVLYALLANMLAVVVLSAIATIFVFVYKERTGILVLSLFCLLVISFPLARHGRVREASLLFVAVMWIAATLMIVTGGRVTTAFVALHVSIAVIAGTLLGGRSAIISTAMSSIVCLGLTILQSADCYPLGYSPPAPPLSNLLMLVFAFILTITPLYLTLWGSARALARARKSERRYATLFDEAPMMYVTLREDNGLPIITDCNAAFLTAMGYAREQVVGQSLMRFYTHRSQQALLDDNGFQRVLRNGITTPIERELKANDGRIIPVLIRAAPDIDDAGQTAGILAMALDVTERKRAEEALRESEELYRRLVTALPEIIVRTDLEGDIVFVNESAVSPFGYTISEWIAGRNIISIVSENDKKRFLGNMKEMFGRYPGTQEYALQCKNGTLVDCEMNGDVLRQNDGTPFGIVFIIRDLTEKKKLQLQLLQSQKMEAIGRLAGGVAHDFNNMIGVILGYASLLEDEIPVENPAFQKIRSIIIAAERSANLTRQLLAFSRQQIITPVVLNLNEELDSLNKMLARFIGEDIALVINREDALWNIRIDPTQFAQILTNLIANARDSISDTGTISVETANVHIDRMMANVPDDIPPGDYVMLSMSDSGCGMDAAMLTHIFEPFFTTKPKEKGTGLGLSTVFGIIKQNNGFISVASHPGQGTIFSLYFPPCHAEPDSRPEDPEKPDLAGKETILVVEDEGELLAIAKKALETRGYTVLTAMAPLEAVALGERHGRGIDLLITDVVMPGMNGKELKKRLERTNPSLRTLYISGYPSDIVANRGVLEEGMLFLQKPFTPLELQKKVRGILDAG